MANINVGRKSEWKGDLLAKPGFIESLKNEKVQHIKAEPIKFSGKYSYKGD
jgi:hypothetical protein